MSHPHPDIERPLIVGTRGSALALWQAETVRNLLTNAHPDHVWELGIIKPEGDLDKSSSLTAIGGRGVFSSALQVALLDGEIDLAVHSTKDVPTLFPPGTGIQAFPLRDDPRDVVVSRHGVRLAELPRNPTIGTSSRRRAVQLLKVRPDAEIIEIRGNIDTRLRKAEAEPYDAVILAAAGLGRMGWLDRVVEFLPFDICTPSPGQGAIAVETRIAPDPVVGLVSALERSGISRTVSLERGFLRAVGGGCTTPIGAHAALIDEETIRFWAMLASEDGERVEHARVDFPAGQAEREVPRLAEEMMRSVRRNMFAAGIGSVLEGRSILDTSGKHFSAELGKRLTVEGAIHLAAPMIEIEPVAVEPVGVDETVDWVVLTSGNAVPALKALLVDEHHRPRIAVVGEQTRSRVEAAGFAVDLVPEDQRGSGLIEAFGKLGVTGQVVVLLQGNLAKPEVADGLRAFGAEVRVVEPYRTGPVAEVQPEALAKIRAGQVDAVVFASPSGVQRFVELMGSELPALSGACLVGIGPVTAEAMASHGLRAHVVASSPNAGAVADDLRAYFGGRLTDQPSDNDVRGARDASS